MNASQNDRSHHPRIVPLAFELGHAHAPMLLLFAGIACGDSAATASHTESDSASAALQSSLDNVVTHGAPGVIGLHRLGSELLVRTSGVRDLETQEAIEPRDRFRVGSNSKPFIATVVLQLAGEGRLGLDDTVERWLPGVLPRGAEISLRQLLNHTSGVAHNAHDPALQEPYLQGNLEHYWSPAELVGFSADEPLAFDPGQGYLYSNTNFHLLGSIIEAVTGADALAEVERRLIGPLALHDTDWPEHDPEIKGQHTHGYHFSPDFGGKFDMTVFSPSWVWTAGGLISTVEDLARFNRALFMGELLAPEEMQAMLTSITTDEGGYGLGVARWETPCGAAWGHEGDFPGFHSLAMTSLDGLRQGVVAINSDDAIGVGLADENLKRVAYSAFCGQ